MSKTESQTRSEIIDKLLSKSGWDAVLLNKLTSPLSLTKGSAPQIVME